MRRDIIDNVKVVEPPLQELGKRHSSFKRTCFTGCGCVLIFLIGAIVAVKLAVGPGPKTLRSVPDNFPKNIPVYDKDTIERITYISGQYKNRGMEIAAFFPKVILSPLLLTLNKDGSEPPASATSTVLEKQAATLRRVWQLIVTPVGDHRDTIQIEWRNMDAEPSFVFSYYKNELRKKGYKIDAESEGRGTRQFSFSHADGTSGALYVKSEEEVRPGTDYAALTVNLSK